jgi:hypothetical protein
VVRISVWKSSLCSVPLGLVQIGLGAGRGGLCDRHGVGRAFSPASDSEPTDMTPVSWWPASIMLAGLNWEATARGLSSCYGNPCRAA